MSLRASLRPAWGNEGVGLSWLAVAFGATVVLGLALQVLALRTLSEHDYATFVFGLGIGNIANAIASAVQPVVAVRAGTSRAAFLPASPPAILGVTVLATVVATVVLAPRVGWLVALFACLQIPLHATVAVGLGRLQARRSFVQIAGALTLWSSMRIAVVVPAVVAGAVSATAFVIALPVALLVEIALLAWLGAYRGTVWRAAVDSRRLLNDYGLWALFGWLINADAIFARLFLSAAGADAYALAITLGRQPIYAVGPLAMVLLPVTVAGEDEGQRDRLRAILLASLLLLVGTLVVIGGWPETIVGWLTGDPSRGNATLIRGYAVVGSLAAAAMLLLTFAFALGRPPRVRNLVVLALVGGVVAVTLATGPFRLLALQLAIVAILVVAWITLAHRVTARVRA